MSSMIEPTITSSKCCTVCTFIEAMNVQFSLSKESRDRKNAGDEGCRACEKYWMSEGVFGNMEDNVFRKCSLHEMWISKHRQQKFQSFFQRTAYEVYFSYTWRENT